MAVEDVLEELELAEWAAEPFHSLSGGYQRRTGIAMAPVSDLEILFLHEPTTGLDPTAGRSTREQIERLPEMGTASANIEIGREIKADTLRILDMQYHALAEPDLFVELLKRATVLEVLRNEPLDRDALEQWLDISTATSYRRTGWLAKRGLIEERESAFSLTALGAEVDGQVTDLVDAVEKAPGRPVANPGRLAELLGHEQMLDLLREAPLDRRALKERLGISRSTCHRHTRALEDAGLVERPASKYELTPTGEVVADAVSAFTRHVRTALTLGPVLDRIHETTPDFDIGIFVHATVTTAEPGNSSRPVARAISLFRETESFRGVRTAAIAPMYLEDERVLDGLPTEVIEPPETTEEIMEEYPERCVEVCVSENFTHWLHDDLPFGLVIYDDRIGIGVEDHEGLIAFVDTDAHAAREWAEAVFESLRHEAIPLDGFTKQGLKESLATQSIGD